LYEVDEYIGFEGLVDIDNPLKFQRLFYIWMIIRQYTHRGDDMAENAVYSEERLEKSLFVEERTKWFDKCGTNYLLKGPAKAREIKNGYLLPLRKLKSSLNGVYEGGVCDADLKFVTGLRRKIGVEGFNYSCTKGYKPDEKTVEVSEESVVFGGVLFKAFGHMLLESLSRLWWFVENPDKQRKIVFLAIPNQKIWCYDFFRLLGIPLENIIIIDQPTKFASIIVPDETIHAWSGFRDKYITIYNAIRDNVKPSKHKKIYLTRTALKQHDCINEEYFEDFYRRRGYEIISPEKYSIDEQISLMAGADEVVCVVGTLSHLALFCKPRTKFVILNRTTTDILTPQLIINQARDAEFRFIDVSMNFLPTRHVWGCFLLAPTNHWVEYLKSEGFDYTEGELEVDIEKISYEYLINWSKHYSNKRNFKTINHHDLFDVVNSIHQALLGSPLARKKLQSGGVLSKSDLLKRNNELTAEIKKLKGTNRQRWRSRLSMETFILQVKKSKSWNRSKSLRKLTLKVRSLLSK